MYLMQLTGNAWEKRYKYEFNIVSTISSYSHGSKTTIKLDKNE